MTTQVPLGILVINTTRGEYYYLINKQRGVWAYISLGITPNLTIQGPISYTHNIISFVFEYVDPAPKNYYLPDYVTT